MIWKNLCINNDLIPDGIYKIQNQELVIAFTQLWKQALENTTKNWIRKAIED